MRIAGRIRGLTGLERGTVPVMSFPWAYWVLPALVLVIWVAAWWRSRRFRLWFALLAPVAAVGGIVLGLALTVSEGREAASSCVGRSCGNVSGFAAGMDGATGIDAVVGAGSVLALLVAVPLTVVTLIVEYVLLVRRQNRQAAQEAAATRAK